MLRHKVQMGEMVAVDRSVEVREVLPRFKPPVVVQFKRDGDLGGVVDVVKSNRNVELGAAVGSGKSTKIPLMLSKAVGTLVIHTIPFEVSARYLAEYLMRTTDGDRVVYMDDIESDMPQHGVVIMTNGFFHARMAHDKFHGVQGAILYLDEIHESDAFTAVLREVAPAMRMFSCVIRATATANPGQVMKPSLPGARTERVYPKTAVATWSTEDADMPWSAAKITGNTLIAMDREATRVRLAAEYREHGFDVRVCAAGVDYGYFCETIRRLSDRAGGIVIVLCDYPYRSSLTIPQLTTLIDSCEVGVPCVDAGQPSWKYRPAYDFEVQQFFGRGARLPGESVTLWRSAEPSPKRMCDLESLECDAANLLYRLLGFRPPPKLATYAYYDGQVPVDIAAAILSDHPLQLCPPESCVPWVNGNVGLRQEVSRAAYEYAMGTKARAKYVSCHTVPDVDRPASPPPPVPRDYRRTRVDVDALDAYRSSRESSPSLDTVYTLHSEMPDNLSIYDEDSEFPAFARPKRVAKHVREQREAAAAAKAAGNVAGLTDSPVSPIGATVHTVPEFPAGLPGTDVARRAATTVAVASDAPRRMTSVTQGVTHLHSVLRDKTTALQVPDAETAAYLYYSGMDAAPEQSNYFFRGAESLFHYCDQHNARLHADALPDKEKLWAMKELIKTSNHATAVAMGIQRLFAEVSGRPTAEWKTLVDHDDLMATLDWMTTQCTDAQLRVRLCRKVMPFFMRYSVDVIPPALELEQRVMIEMMQRFDKAVIKKDPDKAAEYMRKLNDGMISVGARRGVRDKPAIGFV